MLSLNIISININFFDNGKNNLDLMIKVLVLNKGDVQLSQILIL